VIALDYRGRGLSQYDSNPANYALPVELADVLAVVTALERVVDRQEERLRKPARRHHAERVAVEPRVLGRDHGVIISDVWPRGPAEAAGLQPKDVIVAVDGLTVCVIGVVGVIGGIVIAAMWRGVSAPAIRRRTRVCSGGSLKTRLVV